MPPPAKFAARAEDDVQASPAPIPLGDVDRLMQPGDGCVAAALPDVGDGQVAEDDGLRLGLVLKLPGGLFQDGDGVLASWRKR